LEQDHGNDVAEFAQLDGNAFVLLAGSPEKVLVEVQHLLVHVKGLLVLAFFL
jgi:hypothetical protein